MSATLVTSVPSAAIGSAPRAWRWRLAGGWAIFAALLVVLVYGLYDAHLLDRHLWAAGGLRLMLLLAVAYAAFSAVLFRVAPTALAPALAGGALFCAIVAVGLGPIAAASFLALSAVSLGDLVLRRGGFLLPLLTGAALISFAVSIAAHFPINYSIVYAVALAVPIALRARSLRWRVPALPELRSGPAFAAYALLGFILLFHVVAVLKPETGYDALSVHLMAPAYVANHGRWLFDPRQYAWSVMPLGGDWIYTAAYVLGGEFAARLTNFGALLCVLAAIYSLARRYASPAWIALVAALFASTPVVELVTGSLFVDNLLTAMLAGAVVAIDGGSITAAVILLGAALSIKLGALTCVIPIVLFSIRRFRWNHLAALVVLGGLPYLYTWSMTGSALYPFVPSLFTSRFPGHFPPAWDTLYRMTFRSHEYLEAADGAFGFHWLLLAPAVLVLLWTRRADPVVRMAGWTALISAVAVAIAQPYLRYLLPAMALFSVALCGVAGRWSRALAIVCVLLNLYFLPASGWYQANLGLPPPFGFHPAANARAYLAAAAPARGIIDYLNRKRPGEPAWFIGTHAIAGLAGRAFATSWHQPQFSDEARAARTADDIAAVARAHDLRNFVAPSDLAGVEAPLGDFLRQRTVKEYEFGALALFRLRD
jgi:hypothetical protein